MHGLGVTEALGEAVPEALSLAFALVTQLGDPWFMFLLLTGLYWFGDRTPGLADGIDRRRAALVLGLAVGSFVLTVALKNAFGVHRPPGATLAAGNDLVPPVGRDAYARAATADGYGFPSGHAIGATVVYGGLASVLGVASRTRRGLAAGVLVGGVVLSRLVLGVHHLLDVVVGVAVGLAFLGVALRLAEGSPTRAFGLASAVGLAALGVAATPDAVALLGAALGGATAWSLVGPRVPPRPGSRTVAALTAGVGLPLVGGLFSVTYALDLWLPLEFLGGAAALAALLALPVIARTVGRATTERERSVDRGPRTAGERD